MSQPHFKPNRAPTYHADGSVSYWSAYHQRWTRENALHIPERELTAMSLADREQVMQQKQRVLKSMLDTAAFGK